MAKHKKPQYEWFYRSGSGPLVCDNGDIILSIYTYAGRPTISLSLIVAYLDIERESIWQGGRKVGATGPGWRYKLTAWAGSGFNLISLDTEPTGYGVREDGQSYVTKQEAIRAALYEFVQHCDRWLLTPCNSSKPYNTQYGLISRPGGEQLVYYLSLPEWEPMWQLLEEVNRHDDWLTEMRTPKKSILTEQLQLF
jgi:hypothetical protein